MQAAKRVAKNTLILYVRMGITMFVSLYSTRLVLAALGTTDFGIFNVVGGAIAMLTFLNAAMTDASQRFMSFAQGQGDLNRQKQIFNVSITLHLLIALVLIIALEIAGYFFFNGVLNIDSQRLDAAKFVYHFMVLSTFFTVLSVPYDAVINAHENMLFVAILGIIETLIKLTIALMITYTLHDKLILYGALMAVLTLSTLIIRSIYCSRKYIEAKIIIANYFNQPLFKDMLSFASWNFLDTSSAIITQYGLSIVLNNFWGTVLNAAQGIANQISAQLKTFSSVMMKALNPVIAKSEGSGNRELMLNASMTGAKYSYFLLAFFAIPFIIETPFILNIWLKEVPDWAVLFTRLQLLKYLIEQTVIVFVQTIFAKGDIRAFSFIKSILNIMPIFFTILLFHLGFPPYYLYITWILFWEIFGGIVILYFSKIKCGLSFSVYLKNVFIPAIGISTIMLVPGIFLANIMKQGFMRLMFVGTATSILFLISYWYLFTTHQEKKLVIKAINYIHKKIIKKQH